MASTTPAMVGTKTRLCSTLWRRVASRPRPATPTWARMASVVTRMSPATSWQSSRCRCPVGSGQHGVSGSGRGRSKLTDANMKHHVWHLHMYPGGSGHVSRRCMWLTEAQLHAAHRLSQRCVWPLLLRILSVQGRLCKASRLCRIPLMPQHV